MNLRTVGMLVGLLTTGVLVAPLLSFAEGDPEPTRMLVNAPPPEVKESMPSTPPKEGYVWSSGYWKWNGKSYSWVEGDWIQTVDPVKKWIDPTWSREGEKWFFTPGHWY